MTEVRVRSENWLWRLIRDFAESRIQHQSYRRRFLSNSETILIQLNRRLARAAPRIERFVRQTLESGVVCFFISLWRLVSGLVSFLLMLLSPSTSCLGIATPCQHCGRHNCDDEFCNRGLHPSRRRTRQDFAPESNMAVGPAGTALGRRREPSVRRPSDLERVIAFRAAPKMKNMSLIPILGPFGGNQLIAALNAVRPKA
jgi:hypothetical protein